MAVFYSISQRIRNNTGGVFSLRIFNKTLNPQFQMGAHCAIKKKGNIDKEHFLNNTIFRLRRETTYAIASMADVYTTNCNRLYIYSYFLSVMCLCCIFANIRVCHIGVSSKSMSEYTRCVCPWSTKVYHTYNAASTTHLFYCICWI